MHIRYVRDKACGAGAVTAILHQRMLAYRWEYGRYRNADTEVLFMLCSEKFPARLDVWLEAGIAAAGNGGLHTGLRVAGAAKKIFYFFFKKRYTFKKIKHIVYVSVESSWCFLTLAKISAFSRPGIRAGLRRLLQMLLDIFYTYFYRRDSSKFFLKKFVKNVTLFIFLSILYMQAKRANEPRR